MAAQAAIFSDTWLQELEEAVRLSEDITSRLRERDLIISSSGNPSHLESSTRKKITVLGTCLDRLESLLQNPPEKPRLTEEELQRRQYMLSGLRLKTKQMASSFSTSPSKRVVPINKDKERHVGPHPIGSADSCDAHALLGQAGPHVAATVKDKSAHVPLLGAEAKEADQECTLQFWCFIFIGILVLAMLVWTIIWIW